MGVKFSQAIKKSNTDEWYTPRENVKIIVPYLHRGGIRKYSAHSIQRTASSLRC